jgi:cytochrome bd-type quinol oxidase subunit 2
MEENLDEKLTDQEQSKSYYNNSNRKAFDVFIGFLGGLLLLLFTEGGYITDSLSPFRPSLSLFLLIATIVSVLIFIFFRIKRRYIAIGLILSVAIPLILVGGCFGILFITH